MGNINGSGRTQVALANQVKAFNTLNEVLLKDARGKVSFKSGWSDERIASEANITLTLASHIRRKNFGPLGTLPEGARKLGRAQQKIHDLALRVRALEDEMEKIRGGKNA